LKVSRPTGLAKSFSVSEEDAEKLLTRNNEKNDFGPKYPKVKVRRFDPRIDGEKLLDEGSLNIQAHNALQAKLRPNLPPIEAQSSELINDVTKLLDDAGYVEEKVVPKDPKSDDNTGNVINPPRAGRGRGLNTKED
jgi:hypothetical protein